MANQTLGFGATLTWNSVVVAGLTAIHPPELSIDAVDGTTHQSTSANKQFFPGLVDPGEVSIEGFFDYSDPTGQLAMVTDAAARTARTGIVTFPASTGGSWTFTGFITKIKPADLPVDGLVPFTATIKVTGVPTFAVATSAGLTTPFFTMSTGTIIPAVSGSILSYVVEVVTGTTGVTITPTAAAGVITVTANGASQVVGSGNASSSITLGAATTITVITVSVQETNKAPKVYTVNVARA